MLRIVVVIVRVISAITLIAVSTYYLLASIPFSYYHFLQFPHFWWMPVFIRFHPLLLLAAVLVLLRPAGELRSSLKRSIRYVAIAATTLAVGMAAAGWFPAALSYEMAAALSFAPLALLVAASGIDLAAQREVLADASRRRRASAMLATAALAGLLCTAMYLVMATGGGAARHFRPAELALAGAMSLAMHVGMFIVTALVVAFAGRVARGSVPRWWVATAGESAGVAVLLAVLIRRSVLTALILSDARAILLAAALAGAIVTFGVALRLRMASATSPAGARWSLLWLSAALIAGVAVIPRALLLADWGGTLQKLIVVATWMACVALVAVLPSRRWRQLALAVGLIGVTASIVSGGVIAARERAPQAVNDSLPLDWSLTVDRYATFDSSLTILLDVLRPMVSDNDFYLALRRVGDATDNRSLRAVPMQVADPRAVPNARPHIFIVVVDSLRPDYLSPYNPAVTFTPAIDAFAADSLVMRKAFTPYAGTALSQPALWAGGLIPRAMYVKPFSAVNNLERLIEAGGYRTYISVDEILSVILERPPDVRLDAHIAHPERKEEMFKFDLCATVTELTERLDRDAEVRAPVFFYSQPQNLHIRVLAGDAYPGRPELRAGMTAFFNPAVSALRRIDGCFGNLIAFLKARGLYDDSIIVLTSDHGDSYGEAGRWAHAFYMAPETLKIPLIMHVPAVLRQRRAHNPDQVALLTDVTPTLFDLLGFTPLSTGDPFGRSLLPPLAEVPPLRPDELFLIQSSYSRVYGLLDGKARWMYSADANHNREEFYDFSNGSVYPTPATKADRLTYRKWLLERLGALADYYGARSLTLK